MTTGPRHDNSRGPLFRRLIDVDAHATSRPDHVALAERFMAQPEASGTLRTLHRFLRDQLRAALAIPIAVAADDLSVQGPVFEAIDRAIDGLSDDPPTQMAFLLSFLATVGVDALSSTNAFGLGVVRYAAACANDLVSDDSSELRRGLPGYERWLQRPRKSIDLMLLPDEQRDVLREAYYEFRSTHPEVILALRALIDRLRGQPLGTMVNAALARPSDEAIRYIIASASQLGRSSFSSYIPPELPASAESDVENVRRTLVLPRDATGDLLYTRFSWDLAGGASGALVLTTAPRPDTASKAPVAIQVAVPTVLDDPTRIPRRLTRAYAKNVHASLLQQFRAAEVVAASRGRRMAGPRRRSTDVDEIKRMARRLDLRAAGLGPTQIARLEGTETGHPPQARSVRQSIANAAKELGLELPSPPAQSRRNTPDSTR